MNTIPESKKEKEMGLDLSRERERAKLASTITCRAGNRMDDNFIIEK